MLTVEIKKDGFTITGHAQFDEHGKDIVCSAVSFLAQSVSDSLKAYVLLTEDKTSGYMDVALLTTCTASDVLLQHFEESMCTISQAYPENVQLTKNTRIIK